MTNIIKSYNEVIQEVFRHVVNIQNKIKGYSYSPNNEEFVKHNIRLEFVVCPLLQDMMVMIYDGTIPLTSPFCNKAFVSINKEFTEIEQEDWSDF